MKLEKLLEKNKRLKIAVIGSHKSVQNYRDIAVKLGKGVADCVHILLTGACSGLPGIVSQSSIENEGLSIGISPYEKDKQNEQIIINTGFGYKGRNVILIRSANIVL